MFQMKHVPPNNFADGSKMDSSVDSSKSSKDPKQDIKNNGDIEEMESNNLIVDDDDDEGKMTDDGGEDNGRVRVVREQERRYANNARER